MNYNGLKEDKRLVKAVPSARQIAYENMRVESNRKLGFIVEVSFPKSTKM